MLKTNLLGLLLACSLTLCGVWMAEGATTSASSTSTSTSTSATSNSSSSSLTLSPSHVRKMRRSAVKKSAKRAARPSSSLTWTQTKSKNKAKTLPSKSEASAAVRHETIVPDSKATMTESQKTQTVTVPPTPPAGKTAVSQEGEDVKRQIESSAPANSRLQPLEESGKVYASTKDKQAAANDSVAVVSHGAQPKIAAFAPDGRPTVCLALGGGGARGAAHIGVLRVLQREGIPVDYIVGNSMGAVVGGMYSSGVSLEQISELLENGSFKKAYMGFIPPKILIAPLEDLFNPFHKQYAGLYSGKKFTKFLDNHLPQKDMNVQDTKIPFSAVATNLLDGRAYRLSEGRLCTVIKASSALTPLLKPVAIGDKLYMDGGVRANLPAKAARETGAGVVLAVLVDEPLGNVPPKKFMHLGNIGSRMIDIVLATADERQIQYADVVINPNVSGVAILSNHRGDVEKAIHAGELAAEKAMPDIRKALARRQSSVATNSADERTR
jgi:predicted acylesterase/phospholipase RssA